MFVEQKLLQAWLARIIWYLPIFKSQAVEQRYITLFNTQAGIVR